jgi:hypothetical protein
MAWRSGSLPDRAGGRRRWAILLLAAGLGVTPTHVAWAAAPTPPPDQPFKMIHLPVLRFLRQDGACLTSVDVQNVGHERAKAVLVVWGEPGACGAGCRGPIWVTCSALLKPGSTWHFVGSVVPHGSRAGAVFRFGTRDRPDVEVCGDDDICADLWCEALFFGVVGDCDDYARFRRAYEEGGAWGPPGATLAAAAGKGGLAVQVRRDCPGADLDGRGLSASYGGLAGDHLGTFDPVFGGFGYYLPLVIAGWDGRDSLLYIQNAGSGCATVALWFRPQDACGQVTACGELSLAPGEMRLFDAAGCLGSGWRGSGWLRSDQPLATVTDVLGPRTLTSAVAQPKPAPSGLAQGGPALNGPLVYRDHAGWETSLHVQNLDDTDHAKVLVTLHDRSGRASARLVDWICPLGSRTFHVPALVGLPAGWVGSVRVASQPWWSGDDGVHKPPLAGVATLTRSADASSGRLEGAVAYLLWPETSTGSGLDGDDAPATPGPIAVPRLQRGLTRDEPASVLTLAALGPGRGEVAFGVYLYDQNGLLDLLCQRLGPRELRSIDLDRLVTVPPGFSGSAVVSPSVWRHPADPARLPPTALRSESGWSACSGPTDRARAHGRVTRRWEERVYPSPLWPPSYLRRIRRPVRHPRHSPGRVEGPAKGPSERPQRARRTARAPSAVTWPATCQPRSPSAASSAASSSPSTWLNTSQAPPAGARSMRPASASTSASRKGAPQITAPDGPRQ